MAAKKTPKKPTKRKQPTGVIQDPYSDILAMLDELLDTVEDDLSREALDPVAALRVKCATMTVALRMCLLALSCHGQTKNFARQIAQNLDTIVDLKTRWNEEVAEEEKDKRRYKVLEENGYDNEVESAAETDT